MCFTILVSSLLGNGHFYITVFKFSLSVKSIFICSQKKLNFPTRFTLFVLYPNKDSLAALKCCALVWSWIPTYVFHWDSEMALVSVNQWQGILIYSYAMIFGLHGYPTISLLEKAPHSFPLD